MMNNHRPVRLAGTFLEQFGEATGVELEPASQREPRGEILSEYSESKDLEGSGGSEWGSNQIRR